MRAKLFLITLLSFIGSVTLSQNRDSIFSYSQNILSDTIVTAFIKGKRDKQNIKWKFFYKKFELNLSNSSYTIIRFRMTCDFGRKNLIAVRMVEGNIVSPDIEIPDVAKKENYSLKNIGPGDLVTFDDIIVQKEGKCFRIKPFLVFTKL